MKTNSIAVLAGELWTWKSSHHRAPGGLQPAGDRQLLWWRRWWWWQGKETSSSSHRPQVPRRYVCLFAQQNLLTTEYELAPS